jgi:hypothetical protein
MESETKTPPPTLDDVLSLLDRLAPCVERIASHSVDEEGMATKIAIEAAELFKRNRKYG